MLKKNNEQKSTQIAGGDIKLPKWMPGQKKQQVGGSYDSQKEIQKNYRVALITIIAMTSYQVVLCFLNTHFFPVSNILLGATEAFILAAVYGRIARYVTIQNIIIGLSIVGYFAILYVLRGGIDLLALRSLAIIFAFYVLGKHLQNAERADRIIIVLSSIVLVFAFAEYFFTNAYLKTFNILSYNIARGVVGNDVSYMSQNLAINGLRFSGRNILPFLGDQRISSVFLEPVSMGNYAIVVAIWFLSLDVSQWRKNMKFIIIAAVLIVACDSRFAITSIFLLLPVRFLPLLQKRLAVLSFFILAVASLMLLSYFQLWDAAQDNLTGRLARSGESVLNMTFLGVLGLDVPRNLGDMGISFSLENFGVFLVVALWVFFSFLPMSNERGKRFRAMMAIYALSILMISGTSFYSAKTASLLWLLLGVLHCRNSPANLNCH